MAIRMGDKENRTHPEKRIPPRKAKTKIACAAWRSAGGLGVGSSPAICAKFFP
jgi:hypothetical protein